jgi:hypothetical protein
MHERTADNRAEHLVNFVKNRPMSDEKQEQFLVVLDNNRQNHVSAYIRAMGKLSSIDQDSWPLRLCSEFKIIGKNWAKLADLVDLKCGLLDELYSASVISDRQRQPIKAGRTGSDQNEDLLNVFL